MMSALSMVGSHVYYTAILVGNIGIASCQLDPQADMSAADTATCCHYVGYVGSLCHQFMSSQLP